MTKDEIMRLQPGVKLNMLVARLVLGWNYWDGCYDYIGDLPMFTMFDNHAGLYADPNDGNVTEYFDFSGDDGDAWYVLNTYASLKADVGVHTQFGGWACNIRLIGWRQAVYTLGSTMPLAVCRTALLVATVEDS